MNHGASVLALEAPNFLPDLLTVVGYPATASTRTRELLRAARQSSGSNSIARCLFSAGIQQVLLRDTNKVAEYADEILSIVNEHKSLLGLVGATFLRAWALAAAGGSDEGIAEMRRSVSHPMVAEGLVAAVMLVALAETCGRNGRVAEGFDLAADGLTTAERTSLRMPVPELNRLNGELLLMKNPANVAEAERCLRTAIDVAHQQGARLFELRATVSLARLIADRGHRDEARAMLAEIYNWFTEGFDTADLKEAKALLDELSN